MTATVRGISVDGRQGTRNDDGTREYLVVYKVGTDDRADGASTVLSAFGIPSIGDSYQPGNDLDIAAVVVSKTANQADSPWEWTVDVTYSTAIGEPVAFENPLDAPAEVTYGFQQRRVLIPGRYNDPIGPPADKDWEAGIYAPNGELFDPQPEAEINEPVLSIKRNIATISGPTLMALANCVNSDPFFGADPRQLKMGAPQAVKKFHKNAPSGVYWEVSYALMYRWETWDIQLLNQGTYYFAGGKPAAVWSTTVNRLTKKDDAGNPIIVNLTTNGDINTTSTPTFTRIRFYREIPFSGLGLI